MSMTLISVKIIAAIITFLLGLSFGLLPMRLTCSRKHLLSIGDAFAGGVFLSAALLHMLPNAEAGFRASMPSATYPLAMLVIAITFILLFVLENSALLFTKKHFFNGVTTAPILMAFLIMIHAMIEGAALGINTDLASFFIILCAVIAHKSSEGFALSVNLHRYEIGFSKIVIIIFLFSLMTPLGIFIATQISNILQNDSGKFAVAILNSLAAGTFLYLGTVHIIAEPDHIICRCGLLSLLAGMTVMAVVAIWV